MKITKLPVIMLVSTVLTTSSIIPTTTFAANISSLKSTIASTEASNVTLTSTDVLKDDSYVNDTIGKAGKTYTINVSDSSKRYISVTCGKPIKVTLKSPSSLGGLVTYDSGDSRNSNCFVFYPIPGATYELTVKADYESTGVTVLMSKNGSSNSWINYGNTLVQEQNFLPTQQTTEYDVAFKESGTYKVTVASNAKLETRIYSAYGDNSFYPTNNSQYIFYIYGNATNGALQYAINLKNTDSVTEMYTVTIEKIN